MVIYPSSSPFIPQLDDNGIIVLLMMVILNVMDMDTVMAMVLVMMVVLIVMMIDGNDDEIC